MSKTFKKAGFQQGLYQESATAKEVLGTMRITKDGRIFRYAKAGASALAAGKIAVAAAVAADVMNETCASAHAIGDVVIAETITSATYAENYFKGGQFQINDAAGEGHSYTIESSTAVAAGTSITITLEEPLRVALTTSSQFTLVQSPWMATVESTTEESMPIGVTPIVVTAAYYYWAQTGGLCSCLIADTPTVGCNLTLSATAGAVTMASAGATSSSSTITIDDLHSQPIVGYLFGTVGVATEYKPVYLTID